MSKYKMNKVNKKNKGKRKLIFLNYLLNSLTTKDFNRKKIYKHYHQI